MLKLIPQEQPDKGRGKRKKNNSAPRLPKRTSKKNLPGGKGNIIEATGKKLIHYSMSPDTHSDQELAQMIYDMHRANLYLQRVRNKKRNRRRKK